MKKTLWFPGSITLALCVVAMAGAPKLGAAENDACKLLTAADISKATGLMVGQGTAGRPIPGVLGRCTWTGSNRTSVILTLADAQHMRNTIAAQEATITDKEAEGSGVSGIGSKAVAIKGAPFTGGGYILNVLDAKGGFGVSILGKDGTLERVVALAKVVESRR